MAWLLGLWSGGTGSVASHPAPVLRYAVVGATGTAALLVTRRSKNSCPMSACRAVDNESKGHNAATTSAVDDGSTTPVTEAASIPATELVHQNSQEYTSRGCPIEEVVFASLGDCGGKSTDSGACGTGNGSEDSRAQPEDFSFARESS